MDEEVQTPEEIQMPEEVQDTAESPDTEVVDVDEIISSVEDVIPVETESDSPPIIIVNTVSSPDTNSSDPVVEPVEEYVYDEEYGIQVYAVNPITSASGLKGVLLDVLGDYDAIVVEHRYTTTSGSYNYVREIQPDYPWLCSAGIFLALLWSVFAIGGRIICRK